MLLTQMVGVGELTADPGSSLWGSLADEGALYDCLSQVCLVAILAVCDYLSAHAWPARLEAPMCRVCVDLELSSSDSTYNPFRPLAPPLRLAMWGWRMGAACSPLSPL